MCMSLTTLRQKRSKRPKIRLSLKSNLAAASCVVTIQNRTAMHLRNQLLALRQSHELVLGEVVLLLVPHALSHTPFSPETGTNWGSQTPFRMRLAGCGAQRRSASGG